MGDGTDVTGQKYSFTRISLSVNDINIRVKLIFFIELTLETVVY